MARVRPGELHCTAEELQTDHGSLWNAAESYLWLHIEDLGDEDWPDVTFSKALLRLLQTRQSAAFRTYIQSKLPEGEFRQRYPDVAAQAKGLFPVAVSCMGVLLNVGTVEAP